MPNEPHVQQKNHESILSLLRLQNPFSARSRNPKRAKKSAEVVRTAIIGPSSISPRLKKSQAKSQIELAKVQSELGNPKFANDIIHQLRNLDVGTSAYAPLPITPNCPTGPTRAVCFEKEDKDVWEDHFAHLEHDAFSHTTDFGSISSVVKDLRLVDLIGTNFGIGEPASGQGILAGAIPTAEAVMTGVELLTPQLMSLGYATGQAIAPDHTGVHPPTDKISVLTYWWGFELVLPPPTLQYLSKAQSISKTAMNFLAAIATLNNGVREIFPFIRYISQFLEFEFGTILDHNKGLGVVCTATWLMPLAPVPRPWDFNLPFSAPKVTPPPKARSPERLLRHEEPGYEPIQPIEQFPFLHRFEPSQTPPPSVAASSNEDNMSARPQRSSVTASFRPPSTTPSMRPLSITPSLLTPSIMSGPLGRTFVMTRPESSLIKRYSQLPARGGGEYVSTINMCSF